MEAFQFTTDEMNQDFSKVITLLKTASEKIQNRMDYSDNAPTKTEKTTVDPKEYPKLMREADALFEASRYLENVGKYGRLPEVSWFSECARNKERREGCRYRGEIKKFPSLLRAIHLLLTEDSALEKTIEKRKAEKQKVAPRLRSDVDPELISRRETLEKAISVLRKINYHNSDSGGG